MKFCALMLWLAAFPAPPSSDRLEIPPELLAEWQTDAAWIVAGRALDLGATEYAHAVNPGFREVNPLMRDPGVKYVANAAFVVGASLACRELRRRGRPGLAKWTARAIFAVGAGLAVNAVIQEHR